MAKIHFHTLGCRLNQAEAERLAQGFILAGHEITLNPADADFKVINTCTVTKSAGDKSRRAAQPSRDGQKLIVTGCHSQVKPEDFKEVDLLVRNEDKDKLISLTQEKFGMDGFALGMDYRRVGNLNIYPLALQHTRAFVKIQDGCNLRCTFCMTTIARGASHSRPVEDILKEIHTLSKNGCQEVVLTGVHAGSYQSEDGIDLGGLIDRIFKESDIARLRLSSLEPWNFKPHWLKLWEDNPHRMCRHLHMSLQSGSDSVLQRMARVYNTSFYADKFNLLRDSIPDLALTTDIIVGFPGETDEEHAESLAFIERMHFADAHIFTFSSRPGTDAEKMPGHLDKVTKQQRFRDVEAITQSTSAAFKNQMLGKTCPVLWEQRDADGSLTGLTDHYLKVKVTPPTPEPNSLTEVVLERLEGSQFIARPD